VEIFLIFADQQTQGLCRVLNKKIDETQVVKSSFEMRTRSILGNVADTRKGLHEELGLMIQVKT
jgi:hypothetical protein